MEDNGIQKMFRIFYCTLADALLATARAKVGTT
jgi:hypothetical protein